MTNFTPYSFDYYLVIRVSNNSLKKFSYKKFFLFLKALRYFPYILSENSLCPHSSKFCFLSCSSGSLLWFTQLSSAYWIKKCKDA